MCLLKMYLKNMQRFWIRNQNLIIVSYLKHKNKNVEKIINNNNNIG